MSVSTFSGGGFESKLETEGERILRLILDQAVITAHCTLQCHHCKMHCHLCTLQCHECILHTTLYCTVIFCELHSTLSSLQTAHRSPPHCHHCTSHCHRCTVHSHYIEHCKLHTAKGKLHLQLHLV